jgi:hypothetical protein
MMLQLTPETGLLMVAYLLIPVVVGYWTYRDANKRGSQKH